MRRSLSLAHLVLLLALYVFTSASVAGTPAGTKTPGAPTAPAPVPPEATRRFLEMYSSLYRAVRYEAQQAEWASSTDVTPEHIGGRIAAGKALASVVGNPYVIERSREFLKRPDRLNPIETRQLKKILLNASEAPGTIPEIVAQRVEAEGRQSGRLDSFQFCLERQAEKCVKPVTANGIDDILYESSDLGERLRDWEASKETGPALKPGLVELRRLATALYLSTRRRAARYARLAAKLSGPTWPRPNAWRSHGAADRYERAR